MKMRKLLETYYDSYEIQNFFSGKDELVEVFVNPSLKELNKIIKKSDRSYARFAIIGKKLYVWDYKFLHDTILKKLRKEIYSSGIVSGVLGKRKTGKWKFLESNIILGAIPLEKQYLRSIVNKNYSWVDKYVEFTPKWNEYKKQIKKVLK